jgi:hypothetical protein
MWSSWPVGPGGDVRAATPARLVRTLMPGITFSITIITGRKL